MRLHHLHLRKPISYAYSLRLQENLLEQHFAHKTALRADSATVSRAPPPTLITFQTTPTYTVGRRHFKDNPLDISHIRFLTGAKDNASLDDLVVEAEANTFKPRLAQFYPSPRGGLLTYHAPGQLTAYLILDLRAHGITPRCYIRMLENVVMKTCARHGVPNVTTTADPGVWITEKSNDAHDQQVKEPESEQTSCSEATEVSSAKATDRKICAIGVHVTRGVTSHGIGFNIYDSPIFSGSKAQMYTLPNRDGSEGTLPAPGFLSWGFSRITACGLEGKSVTWLTREWDNENLPVNTTQAEIADAILDESTQGNLMHSVAGTLAAETAEALNIGASNIDMIFESDVLSPDDGVDAKQRKRDWNFLQSLPGTVEDERPELDKKTYRIGRLKEDTGLRFI